MRKTRHIQIEPCDTSIGDAEPMFNVIVGTTAFDGLPAVRAGQVLRYTQDEAIFAAGFLACELGYDYEVSSPLAPVVEPALRRQRAQFPLPHEMEG